MTPTRTWGPSSSTKLRTPSFPPRRCRGTRPPAFESLYGQDGTEAPEGESAGTGAVILYVEGSSRADSKPIPLGNPPATVLDSTILDALWMAGASDVHDDSPSFSEIAAYAAALTSCPWWKIAAITTMGRIPSVASSTLAASFAAEGN